MSDQVDAIDDGRFLIRLGPDHNADVGDLIENEPHWLLDRAPSVTQARVAGDRLGV